MAHTWDPDRYLAYADQRGRPFVDLLARVPAERPRTVVDLGCGPGNFGEPSHTIRDELAAEVPYAEHVRDVAVPLSHDPIEYLEAMAGLGCTVDAWETTYLHVLTGEDPVFTWVSGTGARPTLQALPDDLRASFEEEFKRRLAAAYPAGPDGVVLPFRRIFVVAQVPA